MRTIAIDIETFSSVDIKTAGMYKYVDSPDFEVLILAYKIDNEAVKTLPLNPYGELDSYEKEDYFRFLRILANHEFLKTAYNAQFERVCLSKFFGLNLIPADWECTMIKAGMLGLPFGLDHVSKVLKLPENKISEGKALINYFCKPCKPTKANGFRTRNLPEHAPEKWELFKEYCKNDVVVEQAVRNKISFFTMPEVEKKLYCLDQTINDRGIKLDETFVDGCISIADIHADKMHTAAVELSGLENPNSPAQLKNWLTDMTGENIISLTKDAVAALHTKTDITTVKEMLELRQEMSRTSIKKYESMKACICSDGRARGLLQFYGANRTGRWAGRLIQVQNLPQNHLNDLEIARSVVRTADVDLLTFIYDDVPDTLSQLVRTAFVASTGGRFIISDFSSIEARVIAWLAGERWRLDVFNTHGKIYEASASQMFKVPVETIGKGSPLRQKGKIAELALGYQGGANALLTMGALKMGLVEDELPEIVSRWRAANKRICLLWEKLNNSVLSVLQDGLIVDLIYGIRILKSNGILFIRLPSGRYLSYLRPRIGLNRFGSSSILYEGMNQTTKKWETQETYGGKLVENIVQAIARDVLADAMLRLDAAGYNIVMHVHDEIILDMQNGCGSLAGVNAVMSAPIPWAPGLPLKADSYESIFYKKD